MNYNREELERIGFGGLGENVIIHKNTEIFAPENIYLGNDVRIDAFSILSAGGEGVHIGNNVHLAASVFIFGGGGKVVLEDFCGLSSRVTVYTASDDYSEGHLTNPTVPDKYRKIKNGSVVLRRHAIVGSGSIIMPDVEIGIAASVGALSFVNKNIDDFSVVFGHPLRSIGKRKEQILELEKKYLDEKSKKGVGGDKGGLKTS